MNAPILLGQLPADHPDRNRPLKGAWYWPRGAKPSAGKRVLPSYRIAKVTYNDLGPAWTAHDDWTFDQQVAK